MSHIYRTIADYLDLSIDYEYRRLDAVLYDRGAKEPDDRTIRIAVEHENMPNKADQEARQLVTFNFPLSVLITYAGNGKKDGVIAYPLYPDKYFREKFGLILGSKEDLGQFLIIIPDETIAEERTWDYYKYRSGCFEKLL